VAWLFEDPVLILSAGVLSALGGDPTLISHSEAMGVAVRTFNLRGIWVLMRRFSVPTPYLAIQTPCYRCLPNRHSGARLTIAPVETWSKPSSAVPFL